jgi:hypothetical protein
VTRSFGTAYRWVRQDGIDRGELVGTPSVENAELRAARRRITELDAELVTVKRATELFSEGWCAQKHCSPSSRRWRVKVMAPSGCAGSCGWRPRGSSAGVQPRGNSRIATHSPSARRAFATASAPIESSACLHLWLHGAKADKRTSAFICADQRIRSTPPGTRTRNPQIKSLLL